MMSAAQPTKHTSNASLMQLSEVFPTWKQDDLLSVLNEAGGDVYVAISRISEGHVNQWSDNKKTPAVGQVNSRKQSNSNNYSDRKPARDNYNDRKAPSRDNEGQRRDGVQRRQYTPRTEFTKQTPVRKTETSVATVDSTAALDDLSWGDSGETTIEAAPVAVASVSTSAPIKAKVPVAKPVINTAKTSFADAAAAAMAEPKKAPVVAPVPVKIVEQVAVESSNDVLAWGDEPETESVIEVEVKPEPVIVPEPEPEIVIEEVKAPVVEVEVKEVEEEVVLMPARVTPSLTMEQSPVVLPVRTNLRNISVRFGFDHREEAAEAKMESVPVVAAVMQKTPISVAALEGSFAMASANEVGKSSPELAQMHSVPASVSPIAPSSFFPVENTQTSVNQQAGFMRQQNQTHHQYQSHQHQQQQQQHHQQQQQLHHQQQPHYQEQRSYSSTAATGSNVAAASVNTNSTGSFPRSRQNNWDYDNSVAGASSVATNASYGPAPGFSSPASQPATQRFVSRAAAQYDASAAPPYNANRFSSYDYQQQHQDESGNNVSQYYTNNRNQSQQSGYPVYRNNNSNNNSFNSNRYSNPNANANYSAANASAAASRSGSNSAAAPYHPAAHVNQMQQQPQAQLYSQYSVHHQNYMNNYHQHPAAASQQQQVYQQQHHHAGHHHPHGHPEQQIYTPQQAYYQPYQPPTQYLSNQQNYTSSPNMSTSSSDQRNV